MYLGVDVGGTSFKAGLVDEGLRIIDTETCEAAKDAADYGAYLAQSMAGLGNEAGIIGAALLGKQLESPDAPPRGASEAERR